MSKRYAPKKHSNPLTVQTLPFWQTFLWRFGKNGTVKMASTINVCELHADMCHIELLNFEYSEFTAMTIDFQLLATRRPHSGSANSIFARQPFEQCRYKNRVPSCKPHIHDFWQHSNKRNQSAKKGTTCKHKEGQNDSKCQDFCTV